MKTCAGLHYLCLVVVARWGSTEGSSYKKPLMASKDGDIIIGGIFPVHESINFTDDGMPSNRTCTRYTTERMLQVLMLIEAVEAVNNSTLLGNLTLGYRIVDSCSDSSSAVALTHRVLIPICSRPTDLRPVNVIIGGYHSEISIAVARQLSINQIPQISYGSTTGILSDKSRFPAFMRTVPEDNYQAQALVAILKDQGWTWVGVVTTDGDYGSYIARRFQEHARENNICIAFSEVLSDVLDSDELKRVISKTIQNIENDMRIGVIVSFAKPDHMMYIMKMLTSNAIGRIWIASDNWATSGRVVGESTLSNIGTVIGVTLKSRGISHFTRYLEGLNPDPAAHENNTILQQYLRTVPEEGKNFSQSELGEELKKNIYPYAVFSVGLAVRAIASAVADLCANRDCRGGNNFEPWELRNALRNATFKWEPNDTHQYKFDKHGDLNTGYDVIIWQQNGDHITMNDLVATYSIESGNLSFVKGMNITRLVGNMTSSCSEVVSCIQGERKVIPKESQVCCFTCEKCQENSFSNVTDAENCIECNADEFSKEGSSRCMAKQVVFFDWRNSFAIVLLLFAALGLLLTLVVLVLFLTYWSTPIVRASVRPISLLLLISLLGTFISAMLFVGEPNRHQCQARQVLFGLSFTLCVSCILVKSLKILLAFQINSSLRRFLDKPYQPYVIIAACVAVQVVICTAWLTLKSPYDKNMDLQLGQILIHQCDEGSFLCFGLMLGYIGILSLIGFIIAFKGRKLPDGYNEAKNITFGLLIYLFCWVLFGPIYAHSNPGVYLPAVEMVIILFSAYAIFGAVFGTKCYIILFRKERNTREVFRQNVHDYTHRTGTGQDPQPPAISPTNSPNTVGPSHNSVHGLSAQASLASDASLATAAQGIIIEKNRTTTVNSKKAPMRRATIH